VQIGGHQWAVRGGDPAVRQDWFWLFSLCTNGPRRACTAHALLWFLLVGSCMLHVAHWLDTILPAPLEAAADVDVAAVDRWAPFVYLLLLCVCID